MSDRASGERTSLAIPHALAEGLRKRARAADRSVSAEVRMLIREHLDKPTLEQRIEREARVALREMAEFARREGVNDADVRDAAGELARRVAKDASRG